MTTEPWTYLLKIEGVRPGQVPMARLMDYMRAVQSILGVGRALHLTGVEDASTGLALTIDPDLHTEAEERARLASEGLGPKRSRSGYARLEQLARNDNWPVRLLRSDLSEVFSVSTAHDDDVDIGPVHRHGYLQGRVVGIVGQDDTKHVRLLDGKRLYTGITTTEEVAADLGHHLFISTVRLEGQGVWWRRAGAGWGLDRFAATSFKPLDTRPLADVIAEIRSHRLSRWHEFPDPDHHMQQLRGLG